MTITLIDNKIKNNFLRKITTRFNNLIQTLRDEIIDESTYRGLKCTSGSLLRCYGLPKIHKPGFSLRIVVLLIGNPLYNVAKFLHDIFIHLLKNQNPILEIVGHLLII